MKLPLHNLEVYHGRDFVLQTKKGWFSYHLFYPLFTGRVGWRCSWAMQKTEEEQTHEFMTVVKLRGCTAHVKEQSCSLALRHRLLCLNLSILSISCASMRICFLIVFWRPYPELNMRSPQRETPRLQPGLSCLTFACVQLQCSRLSDHMSAGQNLRHKGTVKPGHWYLILPWNSQERWGRQKTRWLLLHIKWWLVIH